MEFVGEGSRPPDFDNHHPGDIAHWMSNTFGGQNLGEHFGLFCDKANKIASINIISPVENPTFDLIVHSRYRVGLALLKITEKETLDRLEATNMMLNHNRNTKSR